MSRVAVVTGGASGIGLGVARRFVADGHHVAVLDRDGAGADAAAAELAGRGGKVIAGAARPGGHARRHRRRLLVPVFRRRQLHHGAGDRRQRGMYI